MSSKLDIKCYWCSDTFGTNRDLKNHAASEKHSMLRVICPWCYDEEKTYRRMSELQKHNEKRHHNLTLEMDSEFFSEANGFWMSIHPEGYMKLVKPRDFESLNAMKARAEVSRWLYRVRKPSRNKDQWEEGWQLGRGKRPVPPQEKTSDRPVMPVSYSPSHPALSEPDLSLVSLNFTSSGNIAYLSSNIGSRTVWFKAELTTDVFEDRKAADNLIRRMRSCPTTTGVPSTFDTEMKEATELKVNIGKQLGIAERHVRRVYRNVIRFEPTELNTKKRKLEAELGIEDDITLEDTMTVNPIIPISPLKPSPAKNTSTLVNNPANDTPTNTTEPFISPLAITKQPTNITPAAEKSIIATVTEPASSAETNPVITTNNELETATMDTQEPEQQTRTVKERASELLKTGVMPLLPPARREWSGIEQISLCEGPTPIMWPPTNWETLSAEERLTVWQFTAMALEYRNGNSFIINRGELLDRYSMLALPGTVIDKVEHRSITPLRVLNYNILKNIYLEKVPDSEAIPYLNVLEAARHGADISAESFGINKIDHVPLRLISSGSSSTSSTS